MSGLSYRVDLEFYALVRVPPDTRRQPLRPCQHRVGWIPIIAPTGAQVIEFGPVNATIHKIEERVSTTDLERLSRIYQDVLTWLLG